MSESDSDKRLRRLTGAAAWGGGEDVPCEYCYQEKARHDPVLGWVGPECEREITEGDDEPEPSEQP